MRFFTTLTPAGQLEYFLVNMSIYGLGYLLIKYVLDLGLAVDELPTDSRLFELETYSYNSSAIGLVAVGLAVLAFLLVINAARRLKDLNKGMGLAVLMVVPFANLLLSSFLTTASSVKDTYTPYGKNPYDPNSWVPPAAPTSGSGISLQGTDIYLPGEEEQAA